MTKKSQTAQPAKTNSALYYLGRILQRLALCVTITLTGIYWVALISSNVVQFQTTGLITDGLKANTLRWAVFTAAVSLLLLTIVRFRKYEKPLVVDGVVIALFCFVSVLVAESLVFSPF